MKINSASVYANRDSILSCMKDKGFSSARVFYCGSGDSGGIEEIDIEGMTGPEPSVKFIKAETSWDRERSAWDERIVEASMPLTDAIREHCYDLLSARHSGWENEDGGEGEFIFDPKDGNINWCHREFYVEARTINHEV